MATIRQSNHVKREAVDNNTQVVSKSPAVKLYEHQAKVFNLSKDRAVYGFFLETGTGKTILTCETIKYLYQLKRIQAAIITAPKTVLRPIWIETWFKYYTDIDFRIVDWIGGMSREEGQVIEAMIAARTKSKPRLLIFLVNVEAFSHNKVFEWVKRICHNFTTIWVIDESTTIKSPNTKRTKQILSVSYLADYKRILSGFPILNHPEDLFTQLQFLKPGITGHKSFYSFRNEFTITRKLDNRVTISLGPRNENKLQALIEPFSSRIMKKDCLDLPDKVRTIREVEMTPQQQAAYIQMRDEGYVAVKNSTKQVFATTILTQLGKMHQIANGLVISAAEFLPCNKYDVMMQIIENEIGDRQFVIWSCFVSNIQQIQLVLHKYSIPHGAIYGQIDMKMRNRDLELFHQGKLQTLVMHPATMMHGHTLAEASYAIYFNNSFNLEHRIQSEDRLHRIGQVNKVTYIDLVTEGTLERRILSTLENKHNVGAEIMGDDWELWFK